MSLMAQAISSRQDQFYSRVPSAEPILYRMYRIGSAEDAREWS